MTDKSIVAADLALSLPQLEQMFSQFAESVEKQLESEDAQAKAESEQAAENALMVASNPQELALGRDRMAQFIAALLAQEQILRDRVRLVERRARHFAALANTMKFAIETFMTNKGLTRIEGFESTFLMRKKPDLLHILNEKEIPSEYYDYKTVRELNKDRLMADLFTGKDVPGAVLETNRCGLNIK